jgi:outer membrane protein OmpA-like peptidoglycan-associated protein
MRGHPGDSAFEELRRIILSAEREQLRDLRDRVSNKERRSQDVANILPEAVKLSRERGDELTQALRPAVEGSIKESIEKKPDTFVDALHPIIGPMVRRSIAESLRRLMQSLNQALEHTFSWRGLKWRFEALRTGKSFAEVVMLRSLVYRVEQIFLIHRKTSLSLLHVAVDPAVAKDSDMVAGMLSAIQDFVRDSFSAGGDADLEEFRVGELQIWIAPGPYAYLAAVIRGDPPRELRTTLEDTIESIHILKGLALANFKGDAAPFESVRPELEACLRSQYTAAKKGGGKKVRAWIAITTTAAFFTALLIVAVRGEWRWRKFVRQLNAQPGLAVTAAHKGWFGPSEITGLRDASAADPTEVARRFGIDPERVHFHWKPFFGLDPASIDERFKKRFNPPSTLQVASKTGVLTLVGSASYEWLERVREEAKFVPGISALDDSAVEVTYNPESVLKRFNEKFDPPNSVNASLVQNILVLSGEAPQEWLARVRTDASVVPGIKSVDTSKVINLDERTFQRSKSVIENAFIYFLTSKDDIASEGFAALSRLPDEIRRCETAAKRIGMNITLEILGYADAVGDEAKNVDLSQRRAHKVADFLSLCGFESTELEPIGMGEAAKPPAMEKATPDLAQRRVSFKVIAEPASTAR